jgi:hypothetical protein
MRALAHWRAPLARSFTATRTHTALLQSHVVRCHASTAAHRARRPVSVKAHRARRSGGVGRPPPSDTGCPLAVAAGSSAVVAAPIAKTGRAVKVKWLRCDPGARRIPLAISQGPRLSRAVHHLGEALSVLQSLNHPHPPIVKCANKARDASAYTGIDRCAKRCNANSKPKKDLSCLYIPQHLPFQVMMMRGGVA